MHHDDGPYLPARLALLPAARHCVTNLTWRPGNFAQSLGNRVRTFSSRADDVSALSEARFEKKAHASTVLGRAFDKAVRRKPPVVAADAGLMQIQ